MLANRMYTEESIQSLCPRSMAETRCIDVQASSRVHLPRYKPAGWLGGAEAQTVVDYWTLVQAIAKNHLPNKSRGN